MSEAEQWLKLLDLLYRRIAKLEERNASLREALDLAEKARIELACLVADPRDPDFRASVPNVADRACIDKAYINLEYAQKAAARKS